MTDYLRVSILGALPGGEKWSVNPHFICDPPGADLTYTDVTTIATAIAAITVNAQLKGAWSTGTSLTGCRVEARRTTGALENVVERTLGTPATGLGAERHPYQTSAVSTLKTTTPGASGRGRLFWPATGITMSNPSLRIETTAQSSLLTGVSAYLAAILAAIRVTAPASSLIVYSKTKNLMSLVNAIAIGDVADVQRRRRDALVENVATSAFAN